MDPTRHDEVGLPLDVLDALQRGQRLQAIKLLRAKAGIDLAQAKRLIDAQRGMQPSLHSRTQTKMNAMIKEDRANSRLLAIAVFLALALLAWKFLIDV